MISDQALLAGLAERVGAAQVLDRPDDLAPYCRDWRGRYQGTVRAVVRPADTPELASVVEFCAAHRIPMVPQGGNTGLCGGATPLADGRAVLISLARMNRIRSVDADNATLIAEAGCTLAQVQQAADEAGCFFPLSLASAGSCTIGGNLSTNAGGVQVLRYGNTRELVLGVEVVLPDGQVWNGLRALRKDNTGYDLKQLFIGAEGTLGIVSAVVLKLFPPPRTRLTAWLTVADPQAAVQLLRALRAECGDRLTAFELIGRSALELVLQHIPGSRAPLGQPADWQVLVELSDPAAGTDLHGLGESLIARLIEQGLVGDAVLAASLAQADALWALREHISEAQKREGFSIKHDIALPVSKVPQFIDQMQAELRTCLPGIRIVCFGHLGDGNLHYNLSCPDPERNAELIAKSAEFNRRVHDRVDALGGSISAEHGLGQLKREEIRRYKSALELSLMSRIKAALDPQGLMNPGKLL